MDNINQETYECIAYEFSDTRAYVWQCVKDFKCLIQNNISNAVFCKHQTTINQLRAKALQEPSESNYKPLILEIGCGNGKNMEYLKNNINCDILGIDNCNNFIKICQKKKLNVLNSNSRSIPLQNNKIDYILCIAMFHHLLTIEERNLTFNEILRVMKSNSFGILTCWSTDQPSKSNFIFTEGINIVPWKGRQNINKIRYYFVYSEKMFREYFESFSEIKIIDIYNEFGNWVLIFQKI
jgi:ubiquinone/menaquinone biosynthesis C-methylase UbiE